MNLKEKLLHKKQKMQEQMQRGRERTQQQKAEKLRKKINKTIDMKPGAKKAILEGLMMNKTPKEVMKDELHRRRMERKNNKDTN